MNESQRDQPEIPLNNDLAEAYKKSHLQEDETISYIRFIDEVDKAARQNPGKTVDYVTPDGNHIIRATFDEEHGRVIKKSMRLAGRDETIPSLDEVVTSEHTQTPPPQTQEMTEEVTKQDKPTLDAVVERAGGPSHPALFTEPLNLTWYDFYTPLKVITGIPLAGPLIRGMFNLVDKAVPLKKTHRKTYTIEELTKISNGGIIPLKSVLFMYRLYRNSDLSQKGCSLWEPYTMSRRRMATSTRLDFLIKAGVGSFGRWSDDLKIKYFSLKSEKQKRAFIKEHLPEGSALLDEVDSRQMYLRLKPSLGISADGEERWKGTPLAKYVERQRKGFEIRRTDPMISYAALIHHLQDQDADHDWSFAIPKSRKGFDPSRLGVIGYTAAGVTAVFWPLAIPAAAFVGYREFRDDIADWVDSILPSLGLGDLPRINDPARQMGETADSLESQTEGMHIEKALGELDDKYDAVQSVEAAIQLLRNTDAEYNTAEQQLGHLKSSIDNHVATVCVKVGDAVMSAVDATSEMLYLDGIVDTLRGMNDWTGWRIMRGALTIRGNRGDQNAIRMRDEIQQLYDQRENMTLGQAITEITNRKQRLEQEQRYENGRNEIEEEMMTATQQMLSIFNGINQTYGLQSDSAILMEGWGNVMESALNQYHKDGNSEALSKTLGEYTQSEEYQALLEKALNNELGEQGQAIRTQLEALQTLSSNQGEYLQTMQTLRQLYVNLGELRDGGYRVVGGKFPIEEQAARIQSLDAKIQAYQKERDELVDRARESKEYIAVNPNDPVIRNEASDLAYTLTDIGSIAVIALVGYLALKKTLGNVLGKPFSIFKRNKN